MSINATIECKEDIKAALHKLRKVLSKEAYRQPPQFFVKASAKKYRHRKKLQHLAILKIVKDRRYKSKYRQPRPLRNDTGADYRQYLWRKFAGGCTFQVPRVMRKSAWQIKHA